MREYDYRTTEVPSHLNSTTIQDEFKKIIQEGFYGSGSKYNDSKKGVKNTLKEMYHYKCAFCEDTLKNSHGDIEHYRPKKSSENLKKCNGKQAYYWLAFSWDNLLPCCEICNGFKSNCFDIKSSRASYKHEILKDLHKSLEAYNKDEEPKLLHPEIDIFENDIFFSQKGKILSKNDRVKYTVRICRLNRNGLAELREEIITDYVNEIKKVLKAIIKIKLEIKEMLILMTIKFNEILDKSKTDKKFSLLSLTIYNNFSFFIDSLSIQKIEKEILLELWKIYIKEQGKENVPK
jgi:uncharacterized protein (TIGR02646 family)